MDTTSNLSQASGGQLIQQAKQAWDQCKNNMPEQHKQELGEIFTELTGRINYVCSGQQSSQWNKYTMLGGSELAQHAHRTVHRTSFEIPAEQRSQLQAIVTELANRVEHVAIGTPSVAYSQGGTQGGTRQGYGQGWGSQSGNSEKQQEAFV